MIAVSPVPSAARYPRPSGVGVEAVDLRRSRDRRRFVEVPRRLHREAAQYVSPLIRDRMWFLDPARNRRPRDWKSRPSSRTRGGRSDACSLRRPDRSVGGRHPTGFFGCFDAPDDPDVSLALFDRARRWLRARGCARLEGPVDLGLEHGGGVLVKGCERAPVVGAAWNPGWYDGLLQEAGLQPDRELMSWGWALDDARSTAQLVDRAERTRVRARIRVRAIDTRRLEAELPDWYAIFNASQRERRGCGPVRRRVFDALTCLAQLSVDDLLLVAEVDSAGRTFDLRAGCEPQRRAVDCSRSHGSGSTGSARGSPGRGCAGWASIRTSEGRGSKRSCSPRLRRQPDVWGCGPSMSAGPARTTTP